MAKRRRKTLPAPRRSTTCRPRRRTPAHRGFQVLVGAATPKRSARDRDPRQRSPSARALCRVRQRHGILQALVASRPPGAWNCRSPRPRSATAMRLRRGLTATGWLDSNAHQPGRCAGDQPAGDREAPAVGELRAPRGSRRPSRRALVQIMTALTAAGFLGPGDPRRIGGELFSRCCSAA